MLKKYFDVRLDDIYRAYDDCRQKKKNKPGTIKFEEHALLNCVRLMEEINTKTYQLKRSECFIVEYPTPREVFCASFRDRVVQHFVYNELNPIIEKTLIQDTCSCRLDKGTDYAIKRVERKVRQISENYTKPYWVMKIDLSGFFMSINRQWLCDKVLSLMREKYTGRYMDVLEYLIPIIILSDVTIGAKRLSPEWKWKLLPARKTLFGNTNGLAIGNITSQLFANFSLNDEDHHAKSRHVGYVRYVDDIIIVDTDRQKMEETKAHIGWMLSEQGMKMNQRKTIIQRGEYGVPFLGVVVKPYYSILGKQRINRIYHGSRQFHDPYKAYQSIATRKGMFQRYHGIRIAHRWFESIDEDIRANIRMENDTSLVWLGPSPVKNNKLLTLEEINVQSNEKERDHTDGRLSKLGQERHNH